MEGWENEFCVRVALENYSDCGGIHITATKKVVSAMREGIGSLGEHPEMISAQSTGFLSEIGTKLRDWAVGQAWGSCYSWAAVSSNDSKTLYCVPQGFRLTKQNMDEVAPRSIIRFRLYLG